MAADRQTDPHRESFTERVRECTMAEGGIKMLMEAERQAATIVAEERENRVQRLKQVCINRDNTLIDGVRRRHSAPCSTRDGHARFHTPISLLTQPNPAPMSMSLSMSHASMSHAGKVGGGGGY